MLFALCLLLLMIVVLVVAPWYVGNNGVMHECCTVVLCVAPCSGGEVGKWCDNITKLTCCIVVVLILL